MYTNIFTAKACSKLWLHRICISGPHPHPHHNQQQKQPYSQFAPASGMLTRDLGQLTGLLPKCFLYTAAGFDSPWPLTSDATPPPPHMQITLACSRRHQRKGKMKDGGIVERHAWWKIWGVDRRVWGEQEGNKAKERGPLKEMRVFWSLMWREVEGGYGSRLGRLHPCAEALKHSSLCFSQPKRTPAPVSARLTVTHADLSVRVYLCGK